MASLAGSSRPAMGRYSLLPSASSWASVSEEAESGFPVVQEPDQRKKLSTFFGVVVPVTLSMFSVILFLRLGFVVGQAGLVLSIGMFVIAYFVVGITVLSISAIATNGPVKEGFVEALLNIFGPSSLNPLSFLREGPWYYFAYASIVLLVSFIIMGHVGNIKPGVGNEVRHVHKYSFSKDYTTKQHQTALTVFAVLFNGVTGIMAGANISGDLKRPGYAIPFGTLGASVFTFIVYIVLVIFTSATCPRPLLRNNYNYIQRINKVPWLITVGAFAATLSAALSCLIGASRILQALAKDDLLGVVLRPFSKITRGEPLRAVLISWFFVQIVLLIGNLNKVAVLVSMFFLLSYGVTNMACFALKVASAPNFSSSWRCIMFPDHVHDKLQICCACCGRDDHFVCGDLSSHAPTPWGDVSQALIYHQVRKYLLRLDLRKEHVKFWRPQVLLLVSNPLSSYPLIDFVNDIKKGGLYILGHVQEGEIDAQSMMRQKRDLTTWLNFVDCTEIKAFVELTVASTLRTGAQSLLMASGLGGMKPNTLVLGFFDHELPMESFSRGIFRKQRFPCMRGQRKDEIYRSVQSQLPPLRTHPGHQTMTLKDYVGIIKDAVLMKKNVCIARNFAQLDKNTLGKEGYIDVWPMNTTIVGEGLVLGPYDFTFLLILQLSCVLHMVPFWESRSKLRVMQIVETDGDDDNHQVQHGTLTRLLKELRIPAEVRMIHVTREVLSQTRNADGLAPATNWYRTVNQLIKVHSADAFVVFTGLPHPPNEENMAQQFIQDITVLSDNLPPVMMVYGKSTVVSTSL
ncbi:hypothetical protein OS493_030065 [Desmophyllum pertusum]|uniref:Solute carrier family 12 member 9 n=1 Tax=Desmophyllum pertusum TaxID=174260 RepID=A0A9W9ZA47_9CNID|nr:hypothetical protein OS493_030065 [Desmophyllum pertusum]